MIFTAQRCQQGMPGAQCSFWFCRYLARPEAQRCTCGPWLLLQALCYPSRAVGPVSNGLKVSMPVSLHCRWGAEASYGDLFQFDSILEFAAAVRQALGHTAWG